jgi:hypothetical protein
MKHDSVLIDGAPEIVQFAPDPDEQVSGAGQLQPRAPSESDLIRSHHPAPIVRQPDRVADQLGWEAVTIVPIRQLLHSTILAQVGIVRHIWLP